MCVNLPALAVLITSCVDKFILLSSFAVKISLCLVEAEETHSDLGEHSLAQGDNYEVMSQTIVRRCIFLLTCVQAPENSWKSQDDNINESTKDESPYVTVSL
jgi:hypothetical protein